MNKILSRLTNLTLITVEERAEFGLNRFFIRACQTVAQMSCTDNNVFLATHGDFSPHAIAFALPFISIHCSLARIMTN